MQKDRPRTARFIIAGAIALAIMQFAPSLFSRSGGDVAAEPNAQALLIQTLNGAQLTNHVTQQTTPTLVFIFASWCPYCKKQAPVMEQLARDFEGKLNILPVSIDKNPNKLAAYLEKSSFALPTRRVEEKHYLDLRRALAASGSQFTGAIPQSILIGTDGQIIDEAEGFVQYPALKSALEKLL